MATNLDINPDLLSKARRLGGLKTKRETVEKALEEFVSHREKCDILDWEGKVDLWPEADPKQKKKTK